MLLLSLLLSSKEILPDESVLSEELCMVCEGVDVVADGRKR